MATVTGSAPKRPAWDNGAIDGYLLELARATQGKVQEHWSEIQATAARQAEADPTYSETRRLIMSIQPAQLEAALLREDQAGQALRVKFPFSAVLTHEERVQHLRDAVLASSLGPLYAQRWQGDPPAAELVDTLVERILAALEVGHPTLRQSFSEFVHAAGSTKWMISADFCLHDNTRPNDVFAFTVFPYSASFEDLFTEIAAVFPKDAKKTKVITPEMVSYLRSYQRFHFAFVVNKDRKLLKNVSESRAAIDRSIAMTERYQDADQHQEAIAHLRRLRQEANANGFNSALLQDIILLATFAGTVALLLQLEGRAELIGFFPDRDAMTTAYRMIGYSAFAQDTSSFAIRRRVPEAQVAQALPGPRRDGRNGIYYDELIRIPDYIASGLSGTDFSQPKPVAVNQKSIDIVAKALIDSDNAGILVVDLPPLTLQAQRLKVHSTLATPAES